MALLLLCTRAVVAQVISASLMGVDARIVEVETELSTGIPNFSVIGLGGAAVQEARYRIQSALRATGIELPHKKITINLAPAWLRKEGAALDLPMALSLLVSVCSLSEGSVKDTMTLGELALTGEIRPVRGVLAAAILAKEKGIARLIVPRGNAREALAVSGPKVIAASTLAELIAHLRGDTVLLPPKPAEPTPGPPLLDLRDVRGQKVARRALEIAAAGAHNFILIGSPGSGKTMLARRLPSILPPMTLQEQMEVTKIWSAAGLTIGSDGMVATRPYRAPHHTISEGGLIGGGAPVRPGEVSLAHNGVLFLDEMPELSRKNLESLRQPLEDREVVIVRVKQGVRVPASFMLVGAANPCPCGWAGHSSGRCACNPEQIRRYLGRLSGPLLDRMDMVIEAPPVTPAEVFSDQPSESSAEVRARVIRARDKAIARSGGPNCLLSGSSLRNRARLTPEARQLLATSMERLELSARSMERAIRVARTIADLKSADDIHRESMAEALRYRAPVALRPEAAA